MSRKNSKKTKFKHDDDMEVDKGGKGKGKKGKKNQYKPNLIPFSEEITVNFGEEIDGLMNMIGTTTEAPDHSLILDALKPDAELVIADIYRRVFANSLHDFVAYQLENGSISEEYLKKKLVELAISAAEDHEEISIIYGNVEPEILHRDMKEVIYNTEGADVMIKEYMDLILTTSASERMSDQIKNMVTNTLGETLAPEVLEEIYLLTKNKKVSITNKPPKTTQSSTTNVSATTIDRTNQLPLGLEGYKEARLRARRGIALPC